MTASSNENPNALDDSVDDEIAACLQFEKPISFFLFAGAGSGKTRSLINALDHIRNGQGPFFAKRGRRVAVITYTNAACDEIKQRLDFDPLIEVSTIHSFVWSLIGSFNADIRKWLHINLNSEIAEIEAAQQKGKAGTKAAIEREKSIEGKRKRLASLDEIKKFVYSPTGDNRGRDALNHSEVISIGASFLQENKTLSNILVNKYPFLLIDESQDTNKNLIDAFFQVQAENQEHFCLGLFGDMMQRIYNDGKVALAASVPLNWARPAKKMNHRCPKRVVRLINKIRAAVDDHEQVARSDSAEGIVRCFVLPIGTPDKFKAEEIIANRMATITGDHGWNPIPRNFKTLTLEHRMAARRMGFLELFDPLYGVEGLRTSFLDGSLPGMRLFAQDVLPLIEALQRGDEFGAAAIVRRRSPLLKSASLKAAGKDQLEKLASARRAATELLALWQKGQPKLMDVLLLIARTGIFELPEVLRAIAGREETVLAELSNEVVDDGAEDRDEEFAAWIAALEVRFDQIKSYAQYVDGTAPFDTHQGVKGREFPRVMVIMDDDEARGFLFKFDKLFGAAAKTETDIKNEKAGTETSVDRTRRLFYVTCSRARNSLAIVAYSANPSVVRDNVIAEGWFEADEVELVG